MYKIVKIDKKGTAHDYGGGYKSIKEVIPAGYKPDETNKYYMKNGSQSVYIVTEY